MEGNTIMDRAGCKLLTVCYFTVLLIVSVDMGAVEIKSTRVIYDGGGRTTQGYLSAINIGGYPSKREAFPVVTKEMSVGPIGEEEGRGAQYAAAFRPLFIVGYDAVSIDWLKANAEVLIKHNAVGYVANVNSKEEMDYLAHLLDDKLLLLPMNVSEISAQLKIKHYPFYIDNTGVLR